MYIKRLGIELVDTFLYGRRIATHRNGTVLRKGNDFIGISDTRVLQDGASREVKKFITKVRRSRDTFEVITATPIKNKNQYLQEYNVTKTYYSHEPKNRYITKESFIGRFFPGENGGNRGWFLSRGGIKVENTNLPNH